ncbi:MAG: hypothetical protein CVU98_06950 [Firmicutes bacterium HGW-Firmicutes-3]|nr:MAG: hypothetical protein CVU98_06950 [Firmicutes bacterium HGW-Firmicutes-3]
MELSKLYEMRYYANSLMNGIDPTSRVQFVEDTVMNIPQIKKYNEDVCNLIDSMIVSIASAGERQKGKIPFFIMKEDRENFPYFEKPVSISELCICMNKFVLPGMVKLRATDLTRGLLNLGYLKEVSIDDEKSYKAPTLEGVSLGIIEEKRTNSYGNSYSVNLYNIDSQKYIVKELAGIIEASRNT